MRVDRVLLFLFILHSVWLKWKCMYLSTDSKVIVRNDCFYVSSPPSRLSLSLSGFFFMKKLPFNQHNSIVKIFIIENVFISITRFIRVVTSLLLFFFNFFPDTDVESIYPHFYALKMACTLKTKPYG